MRGGLNLPPFPSARVKALLEAGMGRAAELENRGPANPDPSRRACFVLRGPGSSSGAPIHLLGLWSVHGALMHLAGPRFVFQGLVRQGGVPYLPTREVPIPPPGP